MKYLNPFLVIIVIVNIIGCGGPSSKSPSTNTDEWSIIKNNTKLDIHLTGFGTPYRQPLSTMGWEDGIYISRDGLDLYCTYAPGDLLSWTLNGALEDQFGRYLRGPQFGMDLITNPAGLNSWVQSDILYAHRNSVNDSFQSWVLSNLAQPVWSEGGVCAIDKSGNTYGEFLFTSNHTSNYKTGLWSIQNASANPSGLGAPLPGFNPQPDYTEDNPHIERIDSNKVILFFDSADYPVGQGQHDIWYSISLNNMQTWSSPANITTINTSRDEIQPHLYYDNGEGKWYLYFAATNPNDSKLAIYRAPQKELGIAPSNWDNWGPKELLIGAGNAAGVGEPTLTANGDISFVVIYQKMDGTTYDKYDADPWFLLKTN